MTVVFMVTATGVAIAEDSLGDRIDAFVRDEMERQQVPGLAVGVISEEAIIPNRAAGYRPDHGKLKNQEWVAPLLNTTADGALDFSLRDLIAWEAALRARALLMKDSWDRILEPVRLTSGKTYPYGFGWFLDQRGGNPLQQHSGSWQGFKSQFSRFLGEDLSVIVLVNLAQANPARFADGIAERVNPDLALIHRPIEDHEPEVTARLSRLLEDARLGALVPTEFAFVRAGFFPFGARAIQDELRTLGPVKSLALVDRVEEGDDRIDTYEVSFDGKTRYYSVGVAPDNRISLFQLREE